MITAQEPITNHLRLAHHLWDLHLQSGDWALDATCGNGYDALFLSSRAEKLFCIDIQEAAISATCEKVPQAVLFQQCHSHLPEEVFAGPLRLITYNLGYLPGSDKAITTQLETTRQSLQTALEKISVGCAVSVTFYPGHSEGLREFDCLHDDLSKLDPKSFCVSTHSWINRQKAPVLSFILKIN